MYKLPMLLPVYDGNCDLGFWTVVNSELKLCNDLTSCTDWLTDWLMYPNICPPPLYKKHQFDTNKCRTVFNFGGPKYVNNFINNALPFLHYIEKKNGFARTKVMAKSDNAIALESSSRWLHNTFALSFYLKYVRTFQRAKTIITSWDDYKVVGDGRDLIDLTRPSVIAILENGKITATSRGLRYKHGWSRFNDGNHSNNGLSFTRYAAFVLSLPVPKNRYDLDDYNKFNKRFKRAKLYLKICQDLGVTP